MTARSEGPDDPEKDEELFALFRGLRDRVFHGSSDLVTRVMRGVEEQLHGKADESLAASLLVQLTNFVTSWLDVEGTDEEAASHRDASMPSPSLDDESEDRPPTEGDDES